MSNENVYYNAVITRANEVKTSQNKQLVMFCATSFALAKNTTFLEKLQVKASDFIEQKNVADKFCVYSLKQTALLVNAINKRLDSDSFFDCSETVQACIRTAINFMNAKRAFTKKDLDSCIDRDAKIADDKKALIYKKREQHDAAYAARQATIALNVMRVLRMIKQENRFEMTLVDNLATKAIVKMLTK